MSKKWPEGWSHWGTEWGRVGTNDRDRAETRSYRNFSKQLRVPISSGSAAAVLHLHAWISTFICSWKNKLLKPCSPILASRTGSPHSLPGNLRQLVCSARESTRDAVEGESFHAWLCLPILAGRLPGQRPQAASVAIYLLPLRRQLSHLERWIVVARPCSEILQERTESPPQGLHENLGSLQPHSWRPHAPLHVPLSNMWYNPAAEFHAKRNLILVPKLRARPRFWGFSKVQVSLDTRFWASHIRRAPYPSHLPLSISHKAQPVPVSFYRCF